MSPADLGLAPEQGDAPRNSRLRGQGRFLGSEVLMVFRRRRNLAILVVLGAVPVLIGVAVKVGDHRERGDSIFGSITHNGLFAALAAFLAVMPLFLPLGVAVVAGDAISGEANTGTLRYLLTVPVARTRLLAVKFGAILVWCAASVAVVAICGVGIGASSFQLSVSGSYIMALEIGCQTFVPGRPTKPPTGSTTRASSFSIRRKTLKRPPRNSRKSTASIPIRNGRARR